MANMADHLTASQQEFYRDQGYLLGLPSIYSAAEMVDHNKSLAELMALLRPGEPAQHMWKWHESSRWLYDICMNSKILDRVEGIIGPDFYLWASNFFIKEPHTVQRVGWHQDAYFWPMVPHNSVTVWLAFTDVDEENGAMMLVPGSHAAGVIRHEGPADTDSMLTLELESGSFRKDTAVSLRMRAGEVSLHDDRAVHGSASNPSDRRRVGLAIRYSGTNVKNDLTVNPYFKAYLARGTDRYHYNPSGVLPTQEYGRTRFE
jgi:non-haem Fe2+, alpha-ketoglutarate-dependent halogenase